MKESTDWVLEKLALFQKKYVVQLERLASQIPHYAKNGKYTQHMEEEDITWWTNGFLGGILWQLYDYSGDELYKQKAQDLEIQLDEAFVAFNGLHHDVGFMWLHTSVAQFRRLENEKSKTRSIHAATLLAGRYNPIGEYLRSWNGDNQHWVIIDSLMNLPLLYWASEELEDERFSSLAVKHADKVLNHHIRSDGSVNHICIFDESGELESTPAGQGFASGSSWSRGQSWAVYGLALSYKYTQDTKYLSAAKRVANYFIANVSESGYVPLVDFRSPKNPKKWDTSAGLCAACGMLLISDYLDEYESDFYVKNAFRMIKAIEEKAADWNPETDGIIGYGTCAYNDDETTHVSLIYSDYFFLEALLRLNNSYQDMW